MWEFIDENVMGFRRCFKREGAFKWFVVTVIGIMIMTEHWGVTSIVRALGMDPAGYECLIHFFHANSWRLEEIRCCWWRMVLRSGSVHRIDGKIVLIGDGVKQSKEGRKMPGVKRLAQESENSAKAKYIHGHMFGGIGVLLSGAGKFFCVLLSLRLHDGNEVIGKWAGDEMAEDTHVVRMMKEVMQIAKAAAQDCIFTADRYFLSVPALKYLAEATKDCGNILTFVTKAKRNAVAYEKPVPPSVKRRGAPAKKGEKVCLSQLFSSAKDSFVETEVEMYGEKKSVHYLAKKLLWGTGLYQELLFVLVRYGATESILVTTNLLMPPETLIEIYALRFKIECSFREFKQVACGFAYRFWTASMPKLNRFAKNITMRQLLEAVTYKKEQNAIVRTLKAIEGFVMFAVIAHGLLQMGTLLHFKEINACPFKWLRTVRNIVPSEATAADFLRKTFFGGSHFSRNLGITRFILDAQNVCSSETSASAA